MMEENKRKLHKMIDSIAKEGTVAYLARFIELWLEIWG